ncbi:MAG: DsrE family protein [Chloroflexi bacterium]|nr:DsrE family protein [Chloroflexota bacterium]
MAKVAIILQAGPGSHESHARMFHSMIYSKELKEKGHEVRLVFDGASTEWLAKWGDPQDGDDRMMGGFFSQLKDAGLTYVVCDFCSGAFSVHDKLKTQGEPLVAEYMNHPSVAGLIDEGFQIITL